MAIDKVQDSYADSINASPENLALALPVLRAEIAAGCALPDAYLTLGFALRSTAYQIPRRGTSVEDTARRQALLVETRDAFLNQTKRFPNDSEGWYWYAMALIEAPELDNEAKRIAALNQALKISPSFVRARLRLGEALLPTTPNQALAEIQEAYRNAQTSNEVSEAGGVLYDALGRLGRTAEASAFAKAEELRISMIDQAEKGARAVRENCAACPDAKRAELERGMATIREAIAKEPTVGAQNWFTLGLGYYTLAAGRWQPELTAAQRDSAFADAATYLRRGIQARPGDGAGYLYLGFLRLKTGDKADALENIRRGIDLAGFGDLLGYTQLAMDALTSAGMDTEAEAIKQQGLKRYNSSVR
jgi:cytochrome c-type biogenesis protein CcmH/NrfG